MNSSAKSNDKSSNIITDATKAIIPPTTPPITLSSNRATVPVKVPRRKPGARECMQISRRFGVNVISQKNMDILLDYKNRGKLEHLIRMCERLDEHLLMLQAEYSGFLCLIQEKGEIDFSSTKVTTTCGNNNNDT